MTIPAYPLQWPTGWQRTADHVEIALKHGVARLDLDDALYLRHLTWYSHRCRGNTYMRTDFTVGGKRVSVMAHRSVMLAERGEIIDHISGDGLDNRRANLRRATNAQNTRNGRSRGGCSQFKGVTADRRRSAPWIAQIGANYRRVSIGGFSDELTAAAAFDLLAAELHGEFARPNLGVLNLRMDEAGQWVPASLRDGPTHPDRGGSPEAFQRVQRAYERATA